MTKNFKKIQLGTRELGLETIEIISAGFEEIPTKKSEKHNPISKLPIWVEIDEKNLKTLTYYFERVTEGDIKEGKSSYEYYNIIGIKRDGCEEFEDIEDAKKEHWHLMYNIPFQYKDSTYLVRIN